MLLIGIGCVIAGIALSVKPTIIRLQKANNLFAPEEIVYNFTHMPEIFRTKELPAASHPHIFPNGPALTLPESFEAFGKTINTQEWLQETKTTGLLVAQDGRIVFEQYYLGNQADNAHISWSLAKSFISALIGIAIQEGKIESVHDPVDEYAPLLKGTGYEGVSLKNVLQMSSGIRFNEDYDDPNSDIVQLARRAALFDSFNDYAKQLVNEKEPGTYRRYTSFDTQVLAMVLQGATGESVTDYMSKKLWQPFGAEHSAWWIVDASGMEMGFGGLNATLRDFAKLGQLYLDHGMLNGKPIVPDAWISASLSMDSAHLLPGLNGSADSSIGYGYQWWIPDSPQRDYFAQGIYSQYIFVSPMTNTVIVKTSADPNYGSDESKRTVQHVEMFRAIATAARKLPLAN
ncbi:Predicted beta-lactamase class C [gamma proteobacterium HdN1]|nr:Predicted beta-lactamase class C [gamma proteobacterium HdN1]